VIVGEAICSSSILDLSSTLFFSCVLCLAAQRSSVSRRSPAASAITAETGWPEARILFMPLARLFQYPDCLLRRNGTRVHWSSKGGANQPAGAVGFAAGEVWVGRMILNGRKKCHDRHVLNLAASSKSIKIKPA